MTEHEQNTAAASPKTVSMTPEQLALLGGGLIAYVRPLKSEDAQRLFPQIGEIRPGLSLYALLSADGSPIILTDSKDAAIANAWENSLQTVSVH
ncbi:DUF1150 domain-containing protein [Roseiarcaceae bacterium H3SJ34-1]|uniref:BQ00720 family protein n=1 Tax=Terripilifer ovatus TaxID=3032367 RepID=UPI003AB92DE0|nr:DUF1150 domain-containing protein [Roseiarcaceae bacterium H3SJ34-1]